MQNLFVNYLILFLLLTNYLIGQQNSLEIKPVIQDTVSWYDISKWGVEGKGWSDVKRYYDRLPERAERLVRKDVWDLSRNSSGMSAEFITDAQEIFVKYSLLKPALAMPHMPATGVSGVDLYAQLENGKWRWVSTSKPKTQFGQESFLKELTPGKRKYKIYLPLYNGIDTLEIGVPNNSYFQVISPRNEKPIVFYGTSIMQGACASRSGMALTAILERRLNIPIINLGFSGNGKMEIELVKLINEIDAAIYIIDCLPNMSPKEVEERTEPLVLEIRKQHPNTPVVLVEDRIFPNAIFTPKRMNSHIERQNNLNKVYKKLLKSGIKNLFYIKGDNLIGIDGEATVDGSHPSDLGMMRYADAYELVLRPIIKNLRK